MEEQNQIIEQLQYINNSISNLDASINNSIINSRNNFGFILILIVLISINSNIKKLTQAIKEYKKYNLVKSQEYSERLRNLLKQYNNRPEIGRDDNSEIEMTIVGLMAFSQEMIEEEDKANKNHLKGRERAFYDALTTDSKAVQLMTDETLRLIAMKLKDVVEKYATVDWSKKKSTQAEMRSQIKRLLDELNKD